MQKIQMMAAVCLMAAATFAAQCAATTKRGTQCKRQASPGSSYCWQHQGTANDVSSFSSASSLTYNTDLFDKVKDKLVIIRGSIGVGSGSFIRMEDGVWLVTNEHVARIGHPLVATTVSNQKVIFSTKDVFQVAKNRDLARFKVSDETPALELANAAPNVGESVWVFGNSDGGGVLTHIGGTINGVGDSEIEVDATFVSGNSGSPILDKNSNVLGLATYATLDCEPSEWAKAGSRFNDIRRFGERLNSVEWETVDWMRYSTQANLLRTFDAYKKFLIPVCFRDKEIVTDYDLKETRLVEKNVQLGRQLSQLTKQDQKMLDVKKTLLKLLDKRQRYHPGSMQYPKDDTINRAKKAVNREILKCYYERNCALRKGRDGLATTIWLTNRMRSDAEELLKGFRFCVRAYNENNKEKLEEYKHEFFKTHITLE